MVDHKTVNLLAPSIAAQIVQWNNNGNIPPYAIVENLDGVSSAAIYYQESDDGNAWSTIAGTTATVNPGLSNGQLITSARRLIGLFAGGNVKLQFTLTRQVNGAPTSLGAA